MAKARRGYGGGVTRLPNGGWQARKVFQGRRIAAYGKTKEKALEELRTKINATEKQSVPPSKLTVAQQFDSWLDASDAGPRTKRNYRGHGERYIKPALGRLKVQRLTRREVNAFIVGLKKQRNAKGQPMSDSLRLAVKKTLSAACAAAVDDDVIPFNPVASTGKKAGAKIKPKRRPHYPLFGEEADRLLDAACRMADSDRTDQRRKSAREKRRGQWLPSLIALAIDTGLRIGELAALRWGDFSTEVVEGRQWVVVSVSRGQTLVEASDGKLVVGDGDPKTESSVRQVPLTSRAAEEVTRYKKTLPADPLPHVRLFSDDRGGRLSPGNFVRREWPRLLKEAGLNRIDPRFRLTPHTLRNARCSDNARRKVNVKHTAALLGHSSTRMTNEVYTTVAHRDLFAMVEEIEAGHDAGDGIAQRSS